MNLYYETTTRQPGQVQYGGNINTLVWHSVGDAGRLAFYNLSYDEQSRLTKATYAERDRHNRRYARDHYSVSIPEYDLNGNILHLKRNGRRADGEMTLIDDLHYRYSTRYHDRLVGLTEHGDGRAGYRGREGREQEFQHDRLGRLTHQENRGLDEIRYTLHSLPREFHLEGGGRHAVVYDGAGTKTAAITRTGQRTDYVDGLEHRNGRLHSIHHEEGRVVKDGGKWVYEYVLRDHLGNTRVVFRRRGAGAEELDVRSTHAYYPFGMEQEPAGGSPVRGSDGFNRLYNGKELSPELGLYDYGARWYDPAIGRWGQTDPLADQYASMSTYNYVANNPMNFVDPDGMRIDISEFLRKDENGDYDQNATVNLVRLLVDIASITGRTVSIAGSELELSGDSEDGGGSEIAANYMQDIINDKEVVTVVNAYKSDQNPNKETGVIPGTNEVQMNFSEVEEYRESGMAAGLEPLNVSGGMRFIHELTHTRIGAKHAGGDHTDFSHKYDSSSDYRPGRSVSFVNKIRSELGFRLRINYRTSSYNPYHIYDTRFGNPTKNRKKIYRGY